MASRKLSVVIIFLFSSSFCSGELIEKKSKKDEDFFEQNKQMYNAMRGYQKKFLDAAAERKENLEATSGKIDELSKRLESAIEDRKGKVDEDQAKMEKLFKDFEGFHKDTEVARGEREAAQATMQSIVAKLGLLQKDSELNKASLDGLGARLNKTENENENEIESDSSQNGLIVSIILLVLSASALVVWAVVLTQRITALKVSKQKLQTSGKEQITIFKDLDSLLQKNLKNFQVKAIDGNTQNSSLQVDGHMDGGLHLKLDELLTNVKKVANLSAKMADDTKLSLGVSNQLRETLNNKDTEISELREGFQHSMLGPLIKGFLILKDNLSSLALVKGIDEITRDQINEFNQSLDFALADIGVSELRIAVESDPLEIDSHKWVALEATDATANEALDGKVATIRKPGYVVGGPEGREIVIRKAEIVRYKYNVA